MNGLLNPNRHQERERHLRRGFGNERREKIRGDERLEKSLGHERLEMSVDDEQLEKRDDDGGRQESQDSTILHYPPPKAVRCHREQTPYLPTSHRAWACHELCLKNDWEPTLPGRMAAEKGPLAFPSRKDSSLQASWLAVET